MLRLFVFSFIGIGLFGAGTTTLAQTFQYKICSSFDSTAPEQPGFSKPVTAAHGIEAVSLYVMCGDTDVKVRVTPMYQEYVYKYGYIWVDGAWKLFEFTKGDESMDGWYSGRVEGRASIPSAQIDAGSSIVAYICGVQNGVWNCGCEESECVGGKWRYLAFDRSQSDDAYNQKFTKIFHAVDEAYNVPPVIIHKVTPSVIEHGETLAVSNFHGMVPYAANTIILKSDNNLDEQYIIPNVPLWHNRLSVPLPSYIPYGVYHVGVENPNGASRFRHFLVVAKPGSKPPTVTGISSDTVRYGETVTLTGTGFTPTGNNVYTLLGAIRDVPSPDGTTLTFEMKPVSSLPNFLEENAGDALTQEFPLTIGVMNENGIVTPGLNITLLF